MRITATITKNDLKRNQKKAQSLSATKPRGQNQAWDIWRLQVS